MASARPAASSARGGDPARHRRQAVGLEHVLHLRLAQPLAPLVQRPKHDASGGKVVAVEQLRHRRRRLHQHFLVPPVVHELHERGDGLRRGVVVGDPAVGEDAPRHLPPFLVEPDGEDGLAVSPDGGFGGRDRDFAGFADRGRTVEYEQAVRLRLLQQRGDDGGVALGVGVGEDVDGVASGPGRRQHRVELLPHGGRRRRQPAAVALDEVGCHGADAAAVADDGQAVAGGTGPAGEGLGRGDQLVDGFDRKHAGAAEGRLVDVAGLDQAAVVEARRRDPGSGAGLEDDDRLDPRAPSAPPT